MSTATEAITEQKRLFREKFGREPGPEGALFFIPESQSPNFSALNHRTRLGKALVQATGESGMDPALVYAMNKTGRIVTDQNLRFLTDPDLREWNDAIDEYHQMIGSSDAQ